MKRGCKSFESKGKAKSNEALLSIVYLTTDNVMLQVKFSSKPWIAVQLSHPDDKKHNVLDPCVFFEIHVVDEVMLELMEKTDKDGYN
mmetsp:Transcript_64194/g.113409  ORF Transcript_64194/g.113409 Transcript_64194/m.113409 type:complete len:87 (-) Transcript_64194:248-508(-)